MKITKQIAFLPGIALLWLASVEPVFAIPSLIPLLPLAAMIVAKIALAAGAVFFFALSLAKHKKKWFMTGSVLLGGAILLYVFL